MAIVTPFSQTGKVIAREMDMGAFLLLVLDGWIALFDGMMGLNGR